MQSSVEAEINNYSCSGGGRTLNLKPLNLSSRPRRAPYHILAMFPIRAQQSKILKLIIDRMEYNLDDAKLVLSILSRHIRPIRKGGQTLWSFILSTAQ